jgi:hypothetical protein
MRPLNYAILKYLTTVEKASAAQVYDALKAEYASFRMCKEKAIFEALLTAEKNGLCEIVDYELDAQGNLVSYFGCPGEYADIINKYVK